MAWPDERSRTRARVSLVTLGVDDLERAVRSCRDGLGLPTDGIAGAQFEHGAVAFFDLQPGLQLALWPRTSLAHDSGLPVAGTADPDGHLWEVARSPLAARATKSKATTRRSVR